MDANRKNPVIISLAVLVVVGMAIAGIVLLRREDDSASSDVTSKTTEATNTTSPSTEAQTEEPATSSQYKSGMYTANGSYTSPGGLEEVKVTVTLDGGIITAAEVEPQPASPTSTEYQGKFVKGFKTLVVGKNIDDIKLSKVSGSSLTSGGFNEALEQIKRDARS